MAARTAWTGSVNFGGFPIPLAAYSATSSKSADSFKSLCPCHSQPISQIKTCATTGEKIDNADLLKGAEMSKGNIYTLDKAALEAISSGESTKSVDVERFASYASFERHLWLADKSFRIIADPKFPGSDKSANVLWNGLRASERVAVIDGWISRAGARPATLVIYADDDGLIGVTLPYERQLVAGLPAGGFGEDEKAAAMFEAFVDAQDYSTDDFDLGTYVDMYRERRDDLIAKAVKGEPIEAADVKPAAPSGPDLMAAMEAAMAGAAKPKAKPARKAKAKAA